MKNTVDTGNRSQAGVPASNAQFYELQRKEKCAKRAKAGSYPWSNDKSVPIGGSGSGSKSYD